MAAGPRIFSQDQSHKALLSKKMHRNLPAHQTLALSAHQKQSPHYIARQFYGYYPSPLSHREIPSASLLPTSDNTARLHSAFCPGLKPFFQSVYKEAGHVEPHLPL